jgi:hypothetical protein
MTCDPILPVLNPAPDNDQTVPQKEWISRMPGPAAGSAGIRTSGSAHPTVGEKKADAQGKVFAADAEITGPT